MEIERELSQIIKVNDFKIGVSNHIIKTDKIAHDFSFINMADFHAMDGLNKNKLIAIKYYLESIKDEIDFITIPGDIENSKRIFDKKDIIKNTFHEFGNISGNIPVFITVGNHEFGVIKGVDEEYILNIFKTISTSLVHPLLNDYVDYNDFLRIYGVFYGKEGYSNTDLLKYNPLYLVNHLNKSFSVSSDKYNICLIHDCFAAYYGNDYQDSVFDLIVSGHAHGGCNRAKRLLDSVYHKGPTDYLVDKKVSNEAIPSYGIHKLSDSSVLSITEGVTRFNGWVPSFVPTIPFVTKIKVKTLTK